MSGQILTAKVTPEDHLDLVGWLNNLGYNTRKSIRAHRKDEKSRGGYNDQRDCWNGYSRKHSFAEVTETSLSPLRREPPPQEIPSKPGSPSKKHSAQATSTPKELQRSSFEAEAGTATTDYAMKPKGDDHTEANNNSPSINSTNAKFDPDDLIYFLPAASRSDVARGKENATRRLLEEEAIEIVKGSLEPPSSGQRQDRMLWSSDNSSNSSLDRSSLERPASHAIAPRASPMFRAENNTRGSSPNCLEGRMDRSVSRRSSFLPLLKPEISFPSVVKRTGYTFGNTLFVNVRTRRPHAPVITGLDPQAKLQVRGAEVPSLQDLPENEHTASKTGDAQTCGSSLYDDFIEFRPGAAKELELALASPNQQRPIYQGQGTNGPHESGQSLGTSSNEPFNFALAPAASLQDSASRTFYNPRPGHSQSTSATIPCNLESKWLLVCARAAQRPTSLFHLDVGSTTSDQQLFAKLRQIYVQAKKASYHSLSFKTVRSIRFVQFELHPRDLVDVRKVPDMPPEAKKDDYLYQSCDLLPPVGENLMTHLFHNPHEANEKAITYLRSPKKRKQKLAICQQMGTNIGWGIHLVEGWAITQFWLSAFAIFSCSFVFAVAWSVLKHDIQGAFGVAGWFVGLATLGLGSFQAVSQGG
ncbi:MAG: hypothetical protein Q9171_003363 [Xanthocarpia ochracea]